MYTRDCISTGVESGAGDYSDRHSHALPSHLQYMLQRPQTGYLRRSADSSSASHKYTGADKDPRPNGDGYPARDRDADHNRNADRDLYQQLSNSNANSH